MHLPEMMRIRQKLDTPFLREVASEVVSQIQALKLPGKIKQGAAIAVGCSSRGIANYALIVRATVESLLNCGFKAFIFPAMGSHGSATPEGQQKVLADYGISEKTIGVPIKSSLDVVQIATTGQQIPVYIDKLAAEADHIVLINRIKAHTEFDADIESGLMKMTAIGLGKKTGATLYHQAVMVHGYYRVITSVARKVLESGKILFGVGIVENGLSQTSQIAVVKAEELEQQEKKLLQEAKRLTARLPFEQVDVLIIDEMGKDISGTGFDTKMVGRILMPLVAEEPKSPQVKRIVVLDLTKNSAGNADGIGIADFVTRRLVDKVDLNALYVNAIAGAEPEHAKIPLTLKNDREAIEVAVGSVGLIPTDKLKIIRIKNTLRLDEIEVSVAYQIQLRRRDDLTVIKNPRAMQFDRTGNLQPF